MTVNTNRIRPAGAHLTVREIPAGQIVAGIVLVILTAILALSAVAIGSEPASASTTARYSADQATCRDFWSWSRHPSLKAFMAMVDESRRADAYLRLDVRGLAHAEHVHAITAIELARGYVAMDCTFTGDQGD